VPAGRGVQLTDAGQALLHTTQAMLGQWQAFTETVDDLRGLRRGVLRLAGVSTSEYFIAQMLKPFVALHPGVEVDLAVENRDAVVQRLQRDQDDLAIMMMPPAHIPLSAYPFMENPLVVIGPLEHPWAQRKRVPLAQLASQPLLMREAGSGTRQAALAHLESSHLTPELRMTLGSNEALKHAVAAGLGVGVISRHALAADPALDGLAVLPVATFPIRRAWQLVWRSDRRLPLAASTFVAFVKARSGADHPQAAGHVHP
jgi:DNA-binding transcriptional LysR family regulator